jgi:hypothetical protein
VIGVESTGGLDREVQALVADLARGADGLGLGCLGLLAGLGEEPLRVVTAAGGLVKPGLPAVVLDYRDGSCGPLGLGGVTVGGSQRPKYLPYPALAGPDQAGDVGDGEPLAALGLPQLPELGDALGAGRLFVMKRGEVLLTAMYSRQNGTWGLAYLADV